MTFIQQGAITFDLTFLIEKNKRDVGERLKTQIRLDPTVPLR